MFDFTITIKLSPDVLALLNRILDRLDDKATIVALRKDIEQRTEALSNALKAAQP